MNQSTNTLGYFVRAARKRKHLSQEALAERVGVCKRTIIDIESNAGNPKFEKYIENGRKLAGGCPRQDNYICEGRSAWAIF